MCFMLSRKRQEDKNYHNLTTYKDDLQVYNLNILSHKCLELNNLKWGVLLECDGFVTNKKGHPFRMTFSVK